jgi:hypothetical protein
MEVKRRKYRKKKKKKVGLELNGENSIKPANDWFADFDELVVDQAAYKLFKTYRSSIFFNEKRHYEFISGLKIDLGTFPTYLYKVIEGEPEEEKIECREAKKKFDSIRAKVLIYKRKAMGLKIMGTAHKAENSLLAPRTDEILELFGRMFTISEVHKVIVEDFRIPCAMDVVERFRKKNVDIISSKIEKYKVEYSDLRLGVKRSRLEEYMYIYTTLKDKFKLSLNREDARVMTTVLESIRKEIEGDKLTIDGNLDISVEGTINVHMQQEVFKNVNIQQIIVARIAAKLGRTATEVVRSLVESYYAKYTGFKARAEGEDADAPMIFPSTMSYDFDQITRKNNSNIQEAKVIESKIHEEKQVIIVESKKLGLRELLLQKIANKNAEIREKQVSVEKARGVQESKEAKRSKKHEIRNDKFLKGDK